MTTSFMDDTQREIDEKAIMIIAKRQPMAADLREIIGAIRISGDLERVGDMGKNIAKRNFAVSETAIRCKLFRGLETLRSWRSSSSRTCSTLMPRARWIA